MKNEYESLRRSRISVKKLTADAYEEWLNTFCSILNDFVAHIEDYNYSPDNKATMVCFLRVAEHVFNHFISHSSMYRSETMKKSIFAAKGSPKFRYDDLKIERNRIADKIASIIEGDPKIHKRFKEFCDNLKEPRMLGCGL